MLREVLILKKDLFPSHFSKVLDSRRWIFSPFISLEVLVLKEDLFPSPEV